MWGTNTSVYTNDKIFLLQANGSSFLGAFVSSGLLRRLPNQNAASQTHDLAAATTGIAIFGRRSLARTVRVAPTIQAKRNLSPPPFILSYLNARQQIGMFGANNRILRLRHWTDNAFLFAD